jgi:hypothetical protein
MRPNSCVGDHRVAGLAFEERLRRTVVAGLALGDRDLDRQAARLDDRVELGAETATRAADRLAAERFLAPAAC